MSLTIVNCTFVNNTAVSGGALALEVEGENKTITMDNCHFSSNSAVGTNASASIVNSNSGFGPTGSSNVSKISLQAGSGGAISLNYRVIKNNHSVFFSNSSNSGSSPTSQPIVSNPCNTVASQVTISGVLLRACNVSFSQNSAVSQGGGLAAKVTCMFESGACTRFSESSTNDTVTWPAIAVANAMFSSNTAGDSGGGVWIEYGATTGPIAANATEFEASSPAHSSLSVVTNISTTAMKGWSVLVVDTLFDQNIAEFVGGGLFLHIGTRSFQDANVSVANVSVPLVDNQVSIIASRFIRNIAGPSGAGFYSQMGSSFIGDTGGCKITITDSQFFLNQLKGPALASRLSVGGAGASVLFGASLVGQVFDCVFNMSNCFVSEHGRSGGLEYTFGGGILLRVGSNGTGDVMNCTAQMTNNTYISNQGLMGGAIFAEFGARLSGNILNCSFFSVKEYFMGNMAYLGGGAQCLMAGWPPASIENLVDSTEIVVNGTNYESNGGNDGGGLYASVGCRQSNVTNSRVNLNSLSLANNFAAVSGGGAYVVIGAESNGTTSDDAVNINNCQFRNNTAVTGAGLNAVIGAQISGLVLRCQVIMRASVFADNILPEGCDSNLCGGGGIFLCFGSGGNPENNFNIVNNSLRQGDVTDCHVLFTDTVFVNNSFVGAEQLANSGQDLVQDSVYGAGFYVYFGATYSPGVIRDSSCLLQNCSVLQNSACRGGGGVISFGTASGPISSIFNCSATVNSSQFIGNQGFAGAGGLLVGMAGFRYGGFIAESNIVDGITVSIFTSVFGNNFGGMGGSGALMVIADCYPGCAAMSAQSVIIEDTQFLNNSAQTFGGAVTLFFLGNHLDPMNNTVLKLNGSVFSDNHAVNGGAFALVFLSLHNFSLDVNYCIFERNLASSAGGAVYFSTWSQSDGSTNIIRRTLTISAAQLLILNNSILRDNMAAVGGGLAADLSELSDTLNCSVNVLNTKFSNNTAFIVGGGASVQGNCTSVSQAVNIIVSKNSFFLDNVAGSLAGALYMTGNVNFYTSDSQYLYNFASLGSSCMFYEGQSGGVGVVTVDDNVTVSSSPLGFESATVSSSGIQGEQVRFSNAASIFLAETSSYLCHGSTVAALPNYPKVLKFQKITVNTLSQYSVNKVLYGFMMNITNHKISEWSLRCIPCPFGEYRLDTCPSTFRPTGSSNTATGNSDLVVNQAKLHSGHEPYNTDVNVAFDKIITNDDANFDNVNENLCLPCPEEGAQCPGGSIVNSLDGYWMCESDCEVKMYECPEGFCLENNYCAEGREPADGNPLCGRCKPGWIVLGNTCAICDSTSESRNLFWFIMLSAVYVVFLLYLCTTNESSKKAIFMYLVQTLNLVLGPMSSWAEWTNAFNFSVSQYLCLGQRTGLQVIILNLITPIMYFAIAFVLFLIIMLVVLLKRCCPCRRGLRTGVGPIYMQLSTSDNGADLVPLQSAQDFGDDASDSFADNHTAILGERKSMGLRLVKGSTSRGTPANEKPATLPVRNCDHDSDDDQLLDFQDQNLPDLCQQDVEAKNGFDQPQNNLSSRSQSNHGNDGLHASTLGGEHATNRDEENEDGQRSDCSQVVTVPDADEPHALHAHSSQSDRLLRRKYAFRRLGLFLLLFTYEALAEQGLQLLNCVDMGNCGTVLAEHPDVVCTDSTYSHLRALAIGILIFTIAYPLLQLIFLVSSLKRGTLYTSQHLTKFGSMYGHFKEKFFWWGVVELVRRALAVFLYVQFFLQRDLRNYSLGIFNFVICSLQLAFQPFHHKSDNLLESISLALLVFASMTQASEAAVHWTMLTTVMKIFLTVGLVLFGTIVVFDLAREHACNVVNYGRGLCAWYKTVFRGWHGAYPNAVDQLQHRSSE